MLAKDAITRAQTIAGIGVIEGNAVNENSYGLSYSIFEQTLSDINNDVKLSLFQEAMDYPQPGSPLSGEYPFPKDCRRVLRGFDRTAEWRKTDFADVMKARKTRQGFQSIYAISNRKIHLSRPSPFSVVYVREFTELLPDEELDIPGEAMPYVINRLAQDLALGFNTGSADRCRALADKAYRNLLANAAVNAGSVYINPNLSYSRFSDLSIW